MTPDSLRVVLGRVFAHNGRTYVAVVAAEAGSCRDKRNAKCCFNDYEDSMTCNCPKGFPSCAWIIFQEARP
jgi:hypothetical protein